MYLSKLEILGFKSFAKKTEFKFHNGITGVVGPNGCGKSNIVDAIRWVLGEQKAGVLRSERMENVIFNGSKTQRPLGMAEVSLTIENTKNILPIDYSEVVITRRLFRSGESQYLLNNSVCRLKDIMDLFMDTGMGANAYSVIELAMVEQILNGKAEERRHIFEEAAGVGKYKARRKAAFRKLEATAADLLRLNDVLSEVEKNVDSLKRQVQKAERYKTYENELKETDLTLSTFQFYAIQHEVTPLTAESKQLHDRREELSAQLATEEAEIEEIRLQVLESEKQLVARQREFNANTERIQKKEEEVLVSQERIRAVQENRSRLAREIDEFSKRSALLAEMRTTLAHKLEEMKSALETLEVETLTRQRELEAQRQVYQGKRQELREAEGQRSTELTTISNLQKEQERLRTQLEFGEQRRAQLSAELAALQGQRTSLDAARDELSRQVAHALAQLDQLGLQSEENQQAVQAKQTWIAEAKQRLLELSAQAQRQRDRASLLRKVQESYEDHPEGVKHLLLEGGMPEGCLGTLGERIRVAEPHRRAVEVALGEAAMALLVDHPDRAFHGIDLLRLNEKGVATFLPAAAHDMGYEGNGQFPFGDEEIVGRLADLVDCDAELRPLMNNMLADFYLVKSLAAARRLAAFKSPRRLALVTPTGELVTNWGPVRGGSEKTVSSVIGRREEIAALEQEVERLDYEIDALTDQCEAAERELRELLAQSERLAQQRRVLEKDRQQLEIEFGQAAFRATKLAEELAQHEQELQQLELIHSDFVSQLASVQPQLQQRESLQSTAENSYRQLAVEIEGLEARLQEAEQAASRATLAVVEARAELRNTEAEINRLEQNRKEISEAIQDREEQIRQAQQQDQELTARIAEIREQLQDDFAERKELEDLVAELEQSFREQKSVAEGKERALRPRRTERDEISEKLHQDELRLAELAMQRANLLKHAQENYEVDLAQYATANPPAADQEFDATATAERVNWLRNRLKSMGPVNMLALTDYEKEKERFDFLTAQKEDLIKAEDNLKETIKVINDTAYERFGKVFSLIRENFIQVFKSFFPDGFVDLRLDEGDPLECDIIIEANPKGKKLGSLALLSGGEKTLTAISLLFAIYLVKPSPFCILDEVDAPLDDNNIGRFTSALRKFAENTQFICVTHNKGTMKSADYLYGVTMEEQGVSKVVSVKFEEADIGQLASNAPPALAELSQN
ncbi:MAG: Chromosome partition protein Smc [bacterium]|nr:Chromosome partition protein Smc [bacterium]